MIVALVTITTITTATQIVVATITMDATQILLRIHVITATLAIAAIHAIINVDSHMVLIQYWITVIVTKSLDSRRYDVPFGVDFIYSGC